MSEQVRAKLNRISSQYSTKVRRLRELKEEKRRPFATDAEVKKINEEINRLDAEIKSDFTELTELKKLEKTAKDYTNLNDDIKEVQAQITKAEARGESTTALKAKRDTLTGKFNSIAPKVEQAFPEIRVTPAKKAEPGPLGNIQMSTGGTVAQAAEPKAGVVKKDAVTPTVDEKLKPPVKKKTPPKAKTPPVTPEGTTGTETATGVEDINAIYTLARSKYGNVDSIFLYDPELKQLLIDAVGDPATAKDDMNADEFARRLGASDWAIRNASTYAKRDAERRQYTETLDKYNQQLELADTQEKKDVILSKIGQLNTTSTYARGLASAKAYIESVASGLTGTMSASSILLTYSHLSSG